MYISCLYEPVGHALNPNTDLIWTEHACKALLNQNWSRKLKKKKSIAQMRQHSKNLLLGYITSLIWLWSLYMRLGWSFGWRWLQLCATLRAKAIKHTNLLYSCRNPVKHLSGSMHSVCLSPTCPTGCSLETYTHETHTYTHTAGKRKWEEIHSPLKTLLWVKKRTREKELFRWSHEYEMEDMF